MHFTSYLQNGNLTVALTGEIDHHCARIYMDSIAGKIEAYMPKRCVLDFGEVSFMDSSGIAVAIHALRCMTRMGGELELIGLQPQPKKVFCASGIDKLISIKEEACEI